MSTRAPGVLFLCTGNSARSLMAEALLRRLGGERFRPYSAGTNPKRAPHPLTLEVLGRHGHDLRPLHSKGWELFSAPDAPPLDFVLTVCDDAHGETCPAWPGQPLCAHWGVDDPARARGSRAKRLQCFERIYTELEARVTRFVKLRFDPLDRLSLPSELAAIGALVSPEGSRSRSFVDAG